jgi:hypothetical protein
MYESLNFDFETLQGQRVIAIRGTRLEADEVARSRCNELALHLEEVVLLVSVNKDTDEVIVTTCADGASLPGPHEWTDIEVLKEYVGYELGWSWIARNYLGYADTLMLSFSGIEPEIALCAVASALWIYRLTRI